MRYGLICLIFLSFLPPLCAQQIGDTVMVIAASGAKLKKETRVVGVVPRGAMLTIKEVTKSRFRVSWNGTTGWIVREDVLTRDEFIRSNKAIENRVRAADYYERGNTWLDKKQYDKAIADYTEAIRLNPKDADAYYGRGYASQEKGDSGKAIADYSEAIRLDPKYAAAHYGRALAYKGKGEFDKAIADYTEAIRLNPKDADAYYGRALAYQGKGDLDKAIADCTEAIRLNAKHEAAYSNRGYAYTTKGDYDKAIADYTEAIRLNPKFAIAYCNRGYSYGAKGDADKAIADYTTAINLNPNSPCLYERRASLLIARGDYDRGMADIQQAIRLNPKDQAAKFEAWPKVSLSADALRHGERQLAQMLKDRKAMRQYGRLAEPLYEWAARKFAGEDLGEEIFWDAANPAPHVDGCNHSPTDEEPGRIRVRETHSDGPDVGKRQSFEEAWRIAVFELYNIASAEDFLRIYHQTLAGGISKEQYVTKMAEIESHAAEKTRSFYIHVFLPWAKRNHLATDPAVWYLALRWDPSDNLILRNIDKKAACWRYHEDAYDSLVAWAKPYNEETKQATEDLEMKKASNQQTPAIVEDRPASLKTGVHGNADLSTAVHRIEPLDVLTVWVRGAVFYQTIQRRLLVEPSGSMSLGASYGRVKVAGLTLQEAEAAIKKHLERVLKAPDVEVLAAEVTLPHPPEGFVENRSCWHVS
jgi:tetratricopeptide (TPR) repeat protein